MKYKSVLSLVFFLFVGLVQASENPGLPYAVWLAHKDRLPPVYSINCKGFIHPDSAEGSTCRLPFEEQKKILLAECSIVKFVSDKEMQKQFPHCILTKCCHLYEWEAQKTEREI